MPDLSLAAAVLALATVENKVLSWTCWGEDLGRSNGEIDSERWGRREGGKGEDGDATCEDEGEG